MGLLHLCHLHGEGRAVGRQIRSSIIKEAKARPGGTCSLPDVLSITAPGEGGPSSSSLASPPGLPGQQPDKRLDHEPLPSQLAWGVEEGWAHRRPPQVQSHTQASEALDGRRPAQGRRIGVPGCPGRDTDGTVTAHSPLPVQEAESPPSRVGGPLSPEASLLGWQPAVFSLGPQVAWPLPPSVSQFPLLIRAPLISD